MGLLDDAIRQHLELKRQHGAPEEEVQRQEEEALGPARRDVAPAEPSGGDGEVELEAPDDAPGAEAASEQETELFEPERDEPATVLREPEEDEPEAAFEPEPEEEPELGAEPALEKEPEAAYAPEPDAEPEPHEEPEGVPEPDALPPSPAPFDASTAFEEFGEDDEDEPDEDAPPKDDAESGEADVLEDTPDFLQETPEHDRLWFEQKPPRDFDFD